MKKRTLILRIVFLLMVIAGIVVAALGIVQHMQSSQLAEPIVYEPIQDDDPNDGIDFHDPEETESATETEGNSEVAEMNTEGAEETEMISETESESENVEETESETEEELDHE